MANSEREGAVTWDQSNRVRSTYRLWWEGIHLTGSCEDVVCPRVMRIFNEFDYQPRGGVLYFPGLCGDILGGDVEWPDLDDVRGFVSDDETTVHVADVGEKGLTECNAGVKTIIHSVEGREQAEGNLAEEGKESLNNAPSIALVQTILSSHRS